MSLTITIPGAVNVTTGSFAPAVLTIGVGVPGAQGPQGIPGVGGAWGSIVGTLSAQGDLWSALSSKYDASNPNGFITSTALVPYITSATAASTYQPLSGMTAYLTTASAASTYAPIAAGLPTGGTVGQVLTKNSGTAGDASFQTLIPGDRYVTTSTSSLTVSNGIKNLTIGTGLAYTPNQDVTISLTSDPTLHHMHGQVTAYNSGTGAMTVDVQNHTGSGTYSAWTVNVGGIVPLQTVEWGEVLGNLGDQTDLATALGNKLETSDAASTYQTIAGMSSYLTTADAATTYYLNTNPDAFITASALTGYATESFVTSQGYITSSALSPYLTSASAASTYADLSGATFTGLISTPAATTSSAFLRLPHGAAPTTPVNGDVWTTTGGLFWRQNGSTQQAVEIGSTQTISGNKTFSNANVSLGTSTATGTIGLASGATISGSTKTVNIGTAGVSGSTTNITVGPVLGASTITVGNTTAASSVNLGTGATISGATKAINIGTNGVSGSTTNIVIGAGGATSLTVINGSAQASTPAVDNNSASIATTAFVVGQAGSATPLVDGTAAVGTSLRYARADHVHPTDTTRAPLASPTFTGTVTIPAGASISGFAPLASPSLTGTPLSTTAAVDTNTTQIATTAYVVGQGYAKLASPTFSGTPSLPTGTTAVTQSPGNNTTAVATTAFVTAAVPAFAATADINSPSSTTKVTSLDSVRRMLLHPGFQLMYLGAGQSQTALGGYYDNNLGGRWKQFDISTTSGSRSQYTFDHSTTSLGFVATTRGQSKAVKDYSKRIYLTGRVQLGTPSNTQRGDANSIARINFGGKNAFGGGDLSASVKGFGWKVAGVIGNAMELQVSNGTTLTTVTSSFVPVSGQLFDWELYSDGTGNVTLTINDSVVATTSAGPTGTSSSGLYLEGIDAIAASVSFAMESFGTKIYFSS